MAALAGRDHVDALVEGLGLVGGAVAWQDVADVFGSAFRVTTAAVVSVAAALEAVAALDAVRDRGRLPVADLPVRTSVPADTCDFLGDNNISTLYVAGGTGAVSQSAYNHLVSCSGASQHRRLAGATRWETAVVIANHFFPTADDFVVVDGLTTDPVDAITASSISKSEAAPILLVPGSSSSPPSVVRAYMDAHRSGRKSWIVGGTARVSSAMENYLESRY